MAIRKKHPTEEVLERYLFGWLPDSELEWVEEHMLICHPCIDKAEQLLAFVESLRNTLIHEPKVRSAAGKASAVDQ
ncbi:MAG TPA: hypothetical protein VE263_10870 [Candidatus Angelobacter sp.]|nr:hypothetical protein [Candidatus Angelobacter sp.]